MKASIVLGTSFGDEGKGRTTDFLCQESNNPIVVRFSAGQQAGHTVIRDGVKHVFSNFGSGTLQNIPTYISHHCTLYINTLINELGLLIEKGFFPKIYVNPLTKLTTPYDVAFNRIIDFKKGHGTCGLGVGATMKRDSTTGYKLYAIDLINQNLLEAKLESIKNWHYTLINEDDKELFEESYSKEEFHFYDSLDRIKDFLEIQPTNFLNDFTEIIFEGSQGILLDMDHGVFPNVTWANTTSKNALEICNHLGIKDITTYYITRCYQTRHGNGWMSNQKEINLINNSEEINIYNQYQGEFRVSELDYDLLNYSIQVDKIYNQNSKYHMVVTCLDQRKDFKFNEERIKGVESFIYFNSPYAFTNNLCPT